MINVSDKTNPNSVDKNTHIFPDIKTLYEKCIVLQQKKQGINL